MCGRVLPDTGSDVGAFFCASSSFTNSLAVWIAGVGADSCADFGSDVFAEYQPFYDAYSGTIARAVPIAYTETCTCADSFADFGSDTFTDNGPNFIPCMVTIS